MPVCVCKYLSRSYLRKTAPMCFVNRLGNIVCYISARSPVRALWEPCRKSDNLKSWRMSDDRVITPRRDGLGETEAVAFLFSIITKTRQDQIKTFQQLIHDDTNLQSRCWVAHICMTGLLYEKGITLHSPWHVFVCVSASTGSAHTPRPFYAVKAPCSRNMMSCLAQKHLRKKSICK